MRLLMRLASGLLGLSMVLTMPAWADDISNWSATDGSNNRAAPLGWQSGVMLPSQVEPTARAMMGAIKRFWDLSAPHARTNTALQGLPTATYPNGVWRDDYSTGLGAPSLWYRPETGTCAANSRVNDGGSCVNTTVGDGNSWFAVFPHGVANVLEFGADPTGVSDNAAIFAAASAASVGGTAYVPSGTYKLSSTPTYTAGGGVQFAPGATTTTSAATSTSSHPSAVSKVLNSTQFGNPNDWLSTYAYGDGANTALWALSPVGGATIVGASRNTDNSGGAAASIGVLGWNFNFNTSTTAAGWGIYGESRRITGAGPAQAAELDATQLGSLVSINTYNVNPGGQAVAAWLASGGGCGVSSFTCWNGTTSVASNPASAAVVIVDNGSAFDKGIVFKNTALGADGATATAIDLARRHQIVWETPAGQGAIIRSDILDSSVYGTSSLIFGQGGSAAVLQVLLSGVGALQVSLGPSGSGNYADINLTAGQTGVDSSISVTGADSNLSLDLVPKGTGGIVIGGGTGLVVPSMPTSCTSKPTGTLWNSSGTVHIC